ncbi:hypothetical protein AB0D46_11745 [Streptomyces sp. NPDC048383]|uniref:hypothetical protein n=1 Tax=Streptomyces sp. NPDC048383 TaxID=3155386 RepID=UPI00343E643C
MIGLSASGPVPCSPSTARYTSGRQVTAASTYPLPVRDTASRPRRGFTVVDGNYVCARRPGDCHRPAADYLALVRAHASGAAQPSA